ncbi:hypothetical protein [Lichenifustis flavocetrariae]|uniref:Uncharacterized protein n=1 Tax=Lichenifustis flavocetrariae TaxID=2949735 RepID=A0AA42CMS7_9HYPH|nr:hypothetical protein [Lichenifustis flavocetrariae]MCW6513009.1 hypothetical protein [Lichenifustis flavocetrariae]
MLFATLSRRRDGLNFCQNWQKLSALNTTVILTTTLEPMRKRGCHPQTPIQITSANHHDAFPADLVFENDREINSNQIAGQKRNRHLLIRDHHNLPTEPAIAKTRSRFDHQKPAASAR